MRNRSSLPPVHVHLKSQMVKTPKRPPGKAFLHGAAFKWEGPTHSLDIVPLLPDPEDLRPSKPLEDITSEEVVEGLHEQISQQNKKIDILQTEVRSLKNEVEQQKKEHLTEHHSDQEEEPEENVRDATQLHRSMKKMLGKADCNRLENEKDALLTKLEEAEMDGKVVVNQVSALRESISKVGSSRLSRFQSSVLARHKEHLLQKLETFESTNRTLRQCLRERRDYQEMASDQLLEQKDTLLKSLANIEAANAHLAVKLQEKEGEVNQLIKLLDNEKENASNTADLTQSLESTRGHLQGQLRQKEAKNNRLTVQIKNLDRAVNQQKGEMEHLTDQLMKIKQQNTEEEALKRAAQAYKQRAQLSEDTEGRLRLQLLDVEKKFADALAEAETWQCQHVEKMTENYNLEAELSVLKSQTSELTEQLQHVQNKVRTKREALLDELHGLTTERAAATLENQSLKVKVSALEKKLSSSVSELQQVRAYVKLYETLVEGYKIQLVKTRAEADEEYAQLSRAERDAQTMQGKLQQEIDAVRGELLGRLVELEPLPEAVQRSELQLQETQDRERSQERHNMELSTTLTDLNIKLESQSSQMELLVQKNKLLLEDNRQLQNQVENLERKLKEAGSQKSDLTALITKQEENIHSTRLRLNEKIMESTLLSQKLEEALDDVRQQILETRNDAAAHELSAQSKILELETQLSRTTSEISHVQWHKEEVEQQYQIQLQAVKDRLEQSERVNQSLQNYIVHLKNSYVDVCRDTAVGRKPRPSSPK
ncbi:outer dense fiber protein 2 isoform X2 [Thalassophryne amazonica]|uniref:outer dense fiber protein 2 isoform X2 n=1 Tax=Thalassophryne amazonica TaxID=390379 RepID=UPI001471AA5D|nr:outer dense fiber protein 2 isoform X2 [Thalassophryne amazonica]